MDWEQSVKDEVLKLARVRRPQLVAITGAEELRGELGLDSLDLAQLVATLEQQLKVDPFLKSASLTRVRTVADLCRVYLDQRSA